MSSKKRPDGDERFLRVQKDPRFWEMPERERKVKIDKRFQSMFHDERFKVKYTVDKRGRPINHTSAEDLKRFYKLSDSEEEEEAGEGKKAAEVKKKKEKKKKDGSAKTEQPKGAASLSEGGEDDDEQRSAEEEEDDLRVSDGSEEEKDQSDEASGSDEEELGLDLGDDSDSGPDLARGKGNIETSSDEDDEDDVDAVLRNEEEEIEHDWGELCKDAPRSDEVSARLAVCNMDWDRLKARDLLALLQSFTPKGGAVLSVKIYPSEFGKERLKAEETQGPMELKALPDDSEDDTEEESFVPDDVKFDEEPKDVATDVNLSAYTPKLFTSSGTATSKVQLTWDETDHERVTALNRKFNKDELLEMDFRAYLASSSEEEEEEEGGGDGAFEEDVKTAADERVVEVEEKKKKKSEEQISKYRELLKGIQEKEKKVQEDKDMEMEVTWVPGLKETTEQLVKKKLEGKDALTPWEEFLQKKREKKKQKKCERKQGAGEGALSDDELPPDVDLSDPFFSEELGAADVKKKQKGKKKKKQEEERRTAEEEEELQKQKAEMALLMDDDDKHKHFNYDKIVEQQNLSKKKRKKLLKKGEELPEDDDFQVDVKDPRFQAMFTSHLFNLDPSHPSYKKTKATQSIVAEKQRRREEEQLRLEAAQEVTPTQVESGGKSWEADTDARATAKQMDPSLSLLVRSIKSKTQQFQARKKQKLV
uniref:ESF1, nucleolar pre-rRNA processing protein, homolog (S. cerevisiae) n=1 Tax=Oreochromis aureus TaxID=47969 RepID=A0AAZ1XG12_OREAU